MHNEYVTDPHSVEYSDLVVGVLFWSEFDLSLFVSENAQDETAADTI